MTTTTAMFSILYLIILAACCVQINSECLNTNGVNVAVFEWLKDKSTAESEFGSIGGWELCSNGISFHNLFNGDSDNDGNVKAQTFNEDISAWDTSGVVTMEGMFRSANVFNIDISNWDTAHVESMGRMFEITPFNQDVSQWDTSNVTSMYMMFRSATAFNQNVSGWDTSAVTSMFGMFWNAIKFNQYLSEWNTSRVKQMEQMFYNAVLFNQDVSEWDTSAVNNMREIFRKTDSFNQDTSSWDTANVSDMNHMFWYATKFNQDLSEWDTSRVTNMHVMFTNAISFNQDISNWDTGNVRKMRYMFRGASAFNQDISRWNISTVTTMHGMFSYAASFEICLVWDISKVQDSVDMFTRSNGSVGCTEEPTQHPTPSPSTTLSVKPSSDPSFRPTTSPSTTLSVKPSSDLSFRPTTSPSTKLSVKPSIFKEYLEPYIVPLSMGMVGLLISVAFAFHFSRKHAATSSVSNGDEESVNNNDDNGLRSRDRLQLCDIIITPNKKPKPSDILGSPIFNNEVSQVFEAEVTAVTSESCLSEVCKLLEKYEPQGFRSLRLLVVAHSRTIGEEMLVSRLSDSYERYVEEGVEERILVENLMKDYFALQDYT